ncbi:FACT complex subunit [Glugoides intestinalis]
MEALTMENLILNKKTATLIIEPETIAIKSGDHTVDIPKEYVKNFELFRGLKAFCLRICYSLADTQNLSFFDIHNVHESFLTKLRQVITSNYGITLPVQELEALQTTQGNLVYTNDLLTLQSEKQVFSIPKSSIKKIIELESDIQLDLGDIEIVFSTTSNLSHFITDKQSQEICIVSGLSCINPRSKSTLVFFKDYVVLKGSSYDHTILYHEINEVFFLKNDQSFYLVFKLENELVQGQTRYESVVFLLADKELEVAAKDPRLKGFYSGKQHDVLLEIFESLLKIKAQESNFFFKCTSKVFDGHLYVMNAAMLFLPKSIYIPIQEISYVEFSRINLSIAQAKTFDMTIYASKTYNFNGIQKEAFSALELYFNENNIKMVSEVINDDYSDDSIMSDEESSDLSDIIGSDE